MKRLRKPFRVILCLIFASISCFFFTKTALDINDIIKLKNEYKTLLKEYNEIKDLSNEMSVKKELVEDDNYIQGVARGKYMFTKEGEQIFILPSLKK